MNKKRFFIFGMGTGIIFSTVVFFAGYTAEGKDTVETVIEEELSDDEIIERAKRLGMVYISELPINQQAAEPKEKTEKPEEERPEEKTEPAVELTEHDMVEGYKLVIIEEGLSSNQIGTLLLNEGIIEDKKAFVDFVKENDASLTLSYGEYKMKNGMSFEEILKMIKG